MKIKHIYRYLLLAVPALTLVGCSKSASDEPPMTRTGNVTIQVADDPNANTNEMIHSWWVAFVSDKTGKVQKITESESLPVDGVSQDIVDTEIQAGTYTVYGFANMTPAELTTATGLTFTVGSKPQANGSDATHEQILALAWDMAYKFNGNSTVQDWQQEENVPMTGFLTGVKLDRALNQDYALEVVRLVAKMEFTFTSTSEQSVVVNSLKMNPYTDEAIHAFPTYTSLGGAPDFTQNKSMDFTRTFTDVKFFPGTEGAGEAKTDWFYLRECVATAQTEDEGTVNADDKDRFRFTINVTKGTAEAKDIDFWVDGLSYINRNDFIKIPVNFSDISDLDAKIIPTFYPPIGGYPAMSFTESTVDAVTTITFGTHGYFEFEPVLLLKDKSELKGYEFVRVSSFKILSNPTGFMDLYFSDNQVVGRINDIIDQATVEFVISGRETATGAFREFTRTVIIKRQ